MRQYAPLIILFAWTVSIQFVGMPRWVKVVSALATVMSAVILVPQFIEVAQKLWQMVPDAPKRDLVPPVDVQTQQSFLERTRKTGLFFLLFWGFVVFILMGILFWLDDRLDVMNGSNERVVGIIIIVLALLITAYAFK